MTTKFLGSDNIYDSTVSDSRSKLRNCFSLTPDSCLFSRVSISRLGLWQSCITPVCQIPRRWSWRGGPRWGGPLVPPGSALSAAHLSWGTRWLSPGPITKAPVSVGTSAGQGLQAGQTWRLSWPHWQPESDKDRIELGVSSWQLNGWW